MAIKRKRYAFGYKSRKSKAYRARLKALKAVKSLARMVR